MPGTPESELIKVQTVTGNQAAELLNVDRSTITHMLRRGSLKGHYDAATRAWAIPMHEIKRVIHQRDRRVEGPGMTEIVSAVDAQYVDAVALLATAASQFLDAHRVLTDQSRRHPDSHPAALIATFQKSLDLLVLTVQRYQQIATTRATIRAIEAHEAAAPHPEDRPQEN
jgi:hypothetical protein